MWLQLVNGGGVKIYVNTRNPVIADPAVQNPPVDYLLPGLGCRITALCLSKKTGSEELFWAEYTVWSYEAGAAAVVSGRDTSSAYTNVRLAMEKYDIPAKGADWDTIFMDCVAVQHYLERSSNAGIAFRVGLAGM